MGISNAPLTKWSGKGSELTTYNRQSPNVKSIRDFVLANYLGTRDLGSYVVRSIRGGKAWSTHAFGAAQDIGFADRDTERRVHEFLVNNSQELGIQGVHAYGSNGLSEGDGIGYIWHSDRSGASQSDGWKKQTQHATGMGQSWAMWLHFEVTEGTWYDGSDVGIRTGPQPERISASGALGWPPFDPAAGLFGLWPLNPDKPVIRWKDVNTTDEIEATRYLQGILRKAGFELRVDGDFGPDTENFVKFCQNTWGLAVTGFVGNESWPRFDQEAA